MDRSEIIIIGGGVIGSACAWRLAREGRSVTLVDDPATQPASEVAAGMLAPVTEAEFGEERLLHLNLLSAEMYPQFIEELAEQTGSDCGYRRSGTLMVARDGDDLRVLEELHEFQTRLGLHAQRLTGREARELEPVLSPRTRGGILVENDHQVDPAALMQALRKACDAAGVTRVEARVLEVRPLEGSVTVRIDERQRIDAPTVVVAAGSHTDLIDGLDAAPPIRPVKGQLVHLRARGGAPLPQRNIRGLDVYIVTRADGRVVIGASVEEQGYDATLTAGAVHDLLRYAYELVPGIVELEFVGVTAGLRPAAPDNEPVIGYVAPGVIVATGHFRNGILLAPATTAAVAALLDGDELEEAAPFDPNRFRERVTK